MTNVLPPRQGPAAWEQSTLLPRDGVHHLNPKCIEELLEAGARLSRDPLPTEVLNPDDFELPTVRQAMRTVRETLNGGIGFAIIDRLPLERLDDHVAVQLYWLLMSAVGRPVAQKWDGTLVYDVLDTGKKPAPGNGVRSSKSNEGQGYHTDNAFNTPPAYVALFCLRTAMEGGMSGLISFDSVYNRLLEHFPDAVPRLFEPFHFDRQREHAPDDTPVSFKPMFETVGGELHVALSTGLVRQGHKMLNMAMDERTRESLESLDAVMEDPALGKSFAFEAGQIQIVNNRRLGHRRTGFKDWPEPERKRHLVRIWLRDEGRRTYHG